MGEKRGLPRNYKRKLRLKTLPRNRRLNTKNSIFLFQKSIQNIYYNILNMVFENYTNKTNTKIGSGKLTANVTTRTRLPTSRDSDQIILLLLRKFYNYSSTHT